jgi:hypothetical protein
VFGVAAFAQPAIGKAFLAGHHGGHEDTAQDRADERGHGNARPAVAHQVHAKCGETEQSDASAEQARPEVAGQEARGVDVARVRGEVIVVVRLA